MATEPAIFTHNKPKDVAEALYESQHKEEADICLVNDSSKALLGKNILGNAIPLPQEQFLTLAELGQAGCLPPRDISYPSEKNRKVIDKAIAKQIHLMSMQRTKKSAPCSTLSSTWNRTAAVPCVLRPKTEEPAFYVKQFPIPAAHLTFIYQQVDELST